MTIWRYIHGEGWGDDATIGPFRSEGEAARVCHILNKSVEGEDYAYYVQVITSPRVALRDARNGVASR